MAKPNWNKLLSEVLGHPTQTITKKSPKTGKDYDTEAILRLEVMLTGEPEQIERDGMTSTIYPVHDPEAKLEYQIKVPGEAKAYTFGQKVIFINVVGGATTSGGWYNADKVGVPKP